MWGTIIADAYTDETRREVAEALDTICSPSDSYGFASGGIYCFWSLKKPRRPLYIGRAVDLPERFREHNGLRGSSGRGNKRDRIREFFEGGEQLLGYSVLVRSVVSQTEVARSRAKLRKKLADVSEFIEPRSNIDAGVDEELAAAEGTAIRSFWLEHGELPAWNEVQGESTRWNRSMKVHDSTGDLFCCSVDSLLQARKTLSELARDPTSVSFEMELQVARMWAIAFSQFDNRQLCDHDVLEMLDRLAEFGGGLDVPRMREQGYLLEGPWVGNVMPDRLSQRQRRAWTDGEAMPPSPPAPPLRLPGEMPWS